MSYIPVWWTLLCSWIRGPSRVIDLFYLNMLIPVVSISAVVALSGWCYLGTKVLLVKGLE